MMKSIEEQAAEAEKIERVPDPIEEMKKRIREQSIYILAQ